jgi:hypothetical protein
MTGSLERFRLSYEEGLRRHLERADETTLRQAYELGREAVERELTVLDVAAVHHDLLGAAVLERRLPAEAADAVRDAGNFLVEIVAAFEMVRRGFRDARDAAMEERRQAQMLRRLSDFLTDASLALAASGSLEEVVQLVAEQACELLPADCAVVTVKRGSEGGLIERSAYVDEGWMALLEQRGGLAAIFPMVTWSGGELHLRGEQLAAHPAFRGLADPVSGLAPGSWLGVALTALDQRELGAIQVLASSDQAFSEVHEAVLAHLAQMVSAAVERVQLYDERGP